MTAEDNNVATFDHSRVDISESIVRFELPWYSPGAYLLVRTTTAENEPYNEGMLRMSGNRQRQIAAGGRLTAAEAKQDQEEDRGLYPKYVVTGWGKLLDKATGEEVIFTLANVKAFFKGVPPWIFNRLRLFTMKPENFLHDEDRDEVVEPNPVDVAGN